MTEKVLLSLILMLAAALGWFVREMLSEIKGTQKEHSTTLSVIKQHVNRVEDKQAAVELALSRVQDTVIAGGQAQRDMKGVLDRNLFEIRQQLKEQADEQYAQKQNFGKIILIVQKLYAATKNGGAK
jgi:hypothetical protein